MRRISRCLLFTVPVLLCLFFFSTCDTGTNPIPNLTPSKTALAAPQNVRINEANFTLMWDPVQNAAEYVVQIDGSSKWIGTSTTYSLGDLAAAEKVYQISVKAVAGPNDSSFSDSAYSTPLDCEPAEYVFEYETTPTPNSKAVTTSGEIVIKGLTSYGKSLANIVIPTAIKGSTVITIGSNAFNGNGVLVSVVIAETVTEVQDNAFWGCTQLATVTFNKSARTSDGETATELGDGVFDSCVALVTIIVPDDSKTAYTTIIQEKAPELVGKVVETASSVPVSGVVLSPKAFELTLEEGKTVTKKLNFLVQPGNATNKAVTWKSSNPNVAGVDNDGLVTAVGQGTATITVTSVSEGKTADSVVTVNGSSVAVTGVTINKTELSLYIGDSDTLSATVQPDNATNKKFTWSSSDPSVAKVDNGLVTAVGPGTATITVRTASGDKTAECVVTVTPTGSGVTAVTGVSVSSNEYTFEKAGDYIELNATVEPSNATNKAVTWKSSNTNVARVDNSGIVIAVGPGTATITVTTVSGSKTASCIVTVKSIAVTGVTIDKTELSLDIGDSDVINATVEPADATNKDVAWYSSDESVAKVDDGLVIAVGEGKATITVSTASGDKTAECVVTVNPPNPDVIAVTGVSVSPNEHTFEKAGDYIELNATVEPAEATNKTVTWKSSNTNVARVDNSGIVTAVGPGTATITVTTVSGSKTAICVVTVNGASDPPGGTQYTVTVELVAGSDKQVVKPGPYTYTAGGSLTIPLELGYTLYEWRLDEILRQEEDIVLTGLGPGTHFVQVIAADGNGVPYSNDLQVTVKEGGGQGSENNYLVSIEVETFEDPRFITNNSYSDSVITQGQSYNIDIADGYTVYEWYLGGEFQSGTGNPLVVSVPNPGTYRIKVIAVRNGIPYTNELTLTVSQ